MEPLPIILQSRQLYNLVNPDKIKTLCQAHKTEDLHKQAKINEVVRDYASVCEEVELVFKGEGVRQAMRKGQGLEYYLLNPSIIEIGGGKGIGKSGMACYVATQFARLNATREIHVLNCAGGITLQRLRSLGQLNYKDVFTYDDLLLYCREAREGVMKEGVRQLLVVDSMTNLLLALERTKQSVCKVFEEFTAMRFRGWVIVFTNYVQNKITSGEEPCLAGLTYFCANMSQLVDCRIMLQTRRWGESQQGIQVIFTKSLFPTFSLRLEFDGKGILQ